MKPLSADEIINLYQLQVHPEGGFFRETYRSAREFSTAIFYLLKAGQKSSLHRLKSDELWHFYLGGPLEIMQIMPDGRLLKTLLGQDISGNQKSQHLVPAGCWFGAAPLAESEFSFVGCTVAPAFQFSDFEMANRNELLRLYPQHAPVIAKLT